MIVQRSEEWFQERLGLATSSNFKKVMAVKTSEAYKGYLTDLVLERLFGMDAPHLQNPYTNLAMQWGTDNEPVARLAYMLKSGNKVKETGFHKHKKLQAGASPDGLIGDKKGLEIKCPTTSTHLYTLRTGKVPSVYTPQVQGQMWICGFESVDFVSFDPRLPENAQLIIIPVKRDEAYIEILEGKTRLFLNEVAEEVKFVKNYGSKVED